MVLATAQGRPEAREGADFFLLTVDVEERMYAAGKIPAGSSSAKARPTERAILTARMIDRPSDRWLEAFTNEVQVICTTALGRPRHAARHPRHQRRLRGARDLAAPLFGPVGAVRIGLVDDELVVNPSLQRDGGGL